MSGLVSFASMSPTQIQQAFETAEQLAQAQHLEEAESLYRRILAQQPDNPDALHLLGLVVYQLGRVQEAVDLVGRAATADPRRPDFAFNLGLILSQTGRTDQAITAYRQALALQPDHAGAGNNLGLALHLAGRNDEAISIYHASLAANPTVAELHFNLGIALQSLGRLDEAVESFRQAAAIKPDYADAWNGIGNVLQSQQKFDQAIEVYRQLLARQPDCVQAHNNLGEALRAQDRLEEAIAAFRQAIALRPDFPESHYNMGIALRLGGNLDDAVAAYRKAISLRPDHAESHNNLGNALKDMGRLVEALASYRRAVAIRPDYADADCNLVWALHYSLEHDAAAILTELRRWNHLHAAPLAASIQPHANDRSPDRRLRIGYVSPDFRNHVVGRNLLPLLREHDHGPFEIFCYSNVARGDAFTEQFRSHADHWRDITQVGDEHAARMIRQDGIDILIDLAGHTAGNRLLVFARKPAPIQATFGGYPGGTGLATMDWRISDPYLDPPGLSETHYVEKIIRLPHSFWCYDPAAMQVQAMGVGPLPALANGCMTFGCLNNFCKISDPTLALWSRVLKRVANSRLLVMAPPGSARQRLLQTMADLGIDAQRIAFVQHQLRQEYLQVYHRIDLGLDTYPYNGHTTSLDSLWMGVPVITLVGERSVGRAGYSQLCNLNLADLAAKDEDEFVKIAAQLAGDLPRLAQLRSSLQERMRRSALTDAAGFARGIQAAYRQMWHAWCAGSCAGS